MHCNERVCQLNADYFVFDLFYRISVIHYIPKGLYQYPCHQNEHTFRTHLLHVVIKGIDRIA